MIRLPGILLGVAMLLATGTAQALGLKMTIADAGDDTVEVTLTNHSFVTHSVLRWETPFENELTTDGFLLINQDNQKVKPEYTGKLLKRGDYKDSDFFALQPGEKISNLIRLTDYYDIDLEATYRVTATGHFNARQVGTQQLLSHTNVLSNTLSMRLSKTPEQAFALPAQLQSCTTEQQNALSGVIEAAETMAMQAKNDFDSLTDAQSRTNSPRLTTWFGRYDANRFNKVSTVFTQVIAALNNQQLTIQCDCPENFRDAFAFVYKNQPYEITMCGSFWSAPQVGHNSKAGTVIHELSHFTIIGDTDDHAYGPGPVKQLAISDPERATDNADSYEYFAENSPPIAIQGDGSNNTTTTTGPIQTATGQVEANFEDQYTFSGSGLITLISTTGDADLEVLLNGVTVCTSDNAASADVCELNQSGDYQINVVGYTDASYELQVQQFTTVAVQGDNGLGGGSSGGGGFFGTTSLLSFLVIAALRFRRKFALKSALPCGLFITLLSACQAPGLSTDNGATSGGTELKSKNGVTQVVTGDEAAAILKLGSLKKEYSPAEQVDVVFSLQNNSDKPIEYLPWGTALEADLTGDVFAIEFNGAELPYVGPVVKRREPVKEDNDILQPGENREVVVNLARSYDMSSPGSYTIKWRDDGALAYQLRELTLAVPESVEIIRVVQ